MSQQKFSKKLKDSVKNLTDLHLSRTFANELLMNGSGVKDPKAVATRLIKDGNDFARVWKEVMEIAYTLTDDQNEKQYFNQLRLGIPVTWEQTIQNFRAKIGELDEKFLSEPMAQNIWSYTQHMVKEASLGSMLDTLVTILPMYYIALLDLKHINNNPNFKPNPYFDVFSFSNWDLENGVLALEALIDARAEKSTDGEKENACEIFRRTLVYEMMFSYIPINGTSITIS